MKISDFLIEKPVQSSWISDLYFNRPNGILSMRLKNGKTYMIPGSTRYGFDRWSSAPSPGKFFHGNIRGKKNINRIN